MKPRKGTGRRTFLKSVALAGSVAAEGAQEQQPKTPARKGAAGSVRGAFDYPRTFSGRQLAMIAFPLGGVGAGSLSLGGRGQLRDWEIFNRPDKGRKPRYAFAAIWAQSGNRKPVSSLLESVILPPYEGSSGLGVLNAPGLPRLDSATFTGEYPMAKIAFHDASLPVKVTLEAFSPFIPLEPDDSGLPVAVLRYHVSNPGAAPARVSIAFAIDNPVGMQGRSNEHRRGEGFEGLLMRNPFLAATDPMSGSFALSVLDSGKAKTTHVRGWQISRWHIGALDFWDNFSSSGELGSGEAARDAIGTLCQQQEIAPRSEATFTFLLSWHFPNRTPERCGWSAPKGEEKALLGNWYSKKFADAWQAAAYAAANLPRLEERTRRFVTAIRESTLPAPVRDAATANLSTLASTTCFRTADGEFHSFEGSNDDRGCCFGNCTHVWNYEAAVPHLFPTFSHSLRESALGFCTDAEGRMDFRQLLPPNKQLWAKAAADGQMGVIMKLYLDWRLSGDVEWLKTHWPAAKRALEFAWIPGGWDADRDGVMEGVQHNTYDVEFYGPNPLCGIWYLGALRAAEEMARALGDAAFAEKCRGMFTNGSKWIDANLFNGEYYIQKVQGIPKEKIAAGLSVGMGATDTQNPDFQLGDGCLVDQLAGQYLADVAGLGNLLDPVKMRKSLQSVFKYNYKRSLRKHESVQRTYALNDEAALLICDYGRGKRPKVPFPYFAEAWTGLEYMTAAAMIYQGLTPQGLQVIESARRRHDGEKRNPWNEPECGHHYARAMSAWGPVLALSGFLYDAPGRTVTAKPRIHAEKFCSFWSCGSGWGVFRHSSGDKGQTFSISVMGGTLMCRKLVLPRAAAAAAQSSAKAGSSRVAHEVRRESRQTIVTFAEELGLRDGDELTVSL